MIIIFFISFNFIGYVLLRNNIVKNYEKDTKILFYKIQVQTSALLSKLLYKYSIEKEVLLQKHKEVQKYLALQKIDPLDVNLKNIYGIINRNTKNNPYNIYVSNQDLIIKNTTFKNDIGFNLSFAKVAFDKHFEENITGISTPLFETSSKKFLSYTDKYLLKKREQSRLLQLSYTYENSKKNLLDIQELIAEYPNIVDVKAYTLVNGGYANYIILKEFPSYKPDLKDIVDAIEVGKKISNRLTNSDLFIDVYTKGDKEYKAMYLSTVSPIFANTKIIYSILLDNSELEDKLEWLNSMMLLSLVLGIIAIFITFKLRKKEIKLTLQDQFVQSSMHEIKTPLSIITLNNELRELEFGRDEYSVEIDSAIKTLTTSYDDMSFTITQDNLDYPREILSLGDMVRERIDYFKSIASSNQKTIEFSMNGKCKVEISRVELTRLIDNNLSNALKYSSQNSTILVVLIENQLSFTNCGKPIENYNTVFEKYVRENSVIGGHGLGLSIVREIAKNNFISIELTSTLDKGTKFLYIFKCHTNDISVS